MVGEPIDFIEIFEAGRQPADKGRLDQSTSAATSLHLWSFLDDFEAQLKNENAHVTLTSCHTVDAFSQSLVLLLLLHLGQRK